MSGVSETEELNPGLSKYRVGFDNYERMEGLIVGRS